MKVGQQGMTLIEMMIVIAIVAIIFGFSTVAFVRVQRSFLMQSADASIAQVLSTAQRRAQDGLQGTAWGVYFPYDKTERTATELIIFSGDSYVARDISRDLSFQISENIIFNDMALSGAGVYTGDDLELVFNLFSGSTSHYGSIELEIFDIEQTITITPQGFITLEGQSS